MPFFKGAFSLREICDGCDGCDGCEVVELDPTELRDELPGPVIDLRERKSVFTGGVEAEERRLPLGVAGDGVTDVMRILGDVPGVFGRDWRRRVAAERPRVGRFGVPVPPFDIDGDGCCGVV